MILNAETAAVPIDSVRPHPRNVNLGDMAAIAESIEHNGFFGSLVVQRSTGHILAGTHRWRAAQQAGFPVIPATYVDVDDATALRIMLADNRTARLGQDETHGLAALLEEIRATQGSLLGTAFSNDALQALLDELGLANRPEPGDDPGAQMDRAAELHEKWGTARGQVWSIPSRTVAGKSHRLMCGDATSSSDVAQLLDGGCPRLMVTDPPYGVEYDPEWRAKAGLGRNPGKMGKVTNDDRADWREAWDLSPSKVAYVWHAGIHASTVQSSLLASGFEVRAQIIWLKDRLVLSRGAYHWRHEPAWYAVRRGSSAGFRGGRRQSTQWGQFDARPSYEWLLELWEELRQVASTWEVAARDDNGHGHGTQKPVECMARPIRNHEGDVYDPFVGSGTTAVAAERERRVCYAMELEPSYVAVIIERLAGMGLEPRRIVDGEGG